MVLAGGGAQSRPASSAARIDPARVAAGAGALAAQGALLLLLLVPMSMPALVDMPRDTGPIVVVPIPTKREVAPDPPPAVVPTMPVNVTFDPKPRSHVPAPITRAPVLPSTGPQQVVEAAAGDTVPAGTGDAGPVAPVVPDTTPMAGARLAYAAAPPPPYPVDALREGRRGTVILQVLVGVDGRPQRVTVSQSSGHRDLDRIAARHVERTWRFQAALRDGQPVQAIGLVPIEFKVD